MRGLPIPEIDEDFTADPVELFFDLVFVFAFSRLVYHLVHHPDWTGVGEFALVFLMMWMPWAQFTWSANAVAGNRRGVRAMFLVATTASVPMAASATAAFDGAGAIFALSLTSITLMALGLMWLAFQGDEEHLRGFWRYTSPVAVALVLFILGGFLDGSTRVWLWIAGLIVFVLGTIPAGSQEWYVRPGHMAERHGLIIIVALGEIIVALGAPVASALADGEKLDGTTVVTLVAAGVFASLLWWGYFDRPQRAFEHGHEALDSLIEKGRFARDVYTFGLIPIVAGVILAASGVEEVALHPGDPLPEAFRWMLFGGVALFLIAVVIAVYRVFRVIAIERLATIAVLLVATLLLRNSDAVVMLIVVDIVLFVALVFEQIRVEGALMPSASTVDETAHAASA